MSNKRKNYSPSFKALDQLVAVEETPKKKIGFTAKEKKADYEA